MNRKLSFKGTHEEVGEQIGLQYKEWGKTEVFVPNFADEYLPIQLQMYERYFPNYILFLEGVAKGLTISKDLVLKSYLTGYLRVTGNPNKCSTFVIQTDNDVLVGRNYDWLESSEKISSIINIEYSDDAYNFTGITDMGTWQPGKRVSPESYLIMIDDAWNEKGLYISLNGAPGDKLKIGMIATHVIQTVVENCTTTKEAVEYLLRIPMFDSKIYTIADKSGDFAVVENSIENGIHVRNDNQMLITTNHFNHEKLLSENIQLFKTVPFHSTFGRYHYLEYNLIENGYNMDCDKAVDLLSNPPVKQNWRGIENGDVISIWNYGLNLSTGKYKIVFAPCLDEKYIIENY